MGSEWEKEDRPSLSSSHEGEKRFAARVVESSMSYRRKRATKKEEKKKKRALHRLPEKKKKKSCMGEGKKKEFHAEGRDPHRDKGGGVGSPCLIIEERGKGGGRVDGEERRSL